MRFSAQGGRIPVVEDKGEYRSLTPQEIGQAVATFRNMLGMKQLALALEAKVEERTVQRIEAGNKVSEDTLRKIAGALRLEENAFIGPRQVLTEEAAESKAAKLLSSVLTIKPCRLDSVKDYFTIFEAHAWVVDDENVSAELAAQVAELRDSLQDWGDIYKDISYTERLAACEALLEKIRDIEKEKYRTLYGVYTTDEDLCVAVLLILPEERASHLKQMLVPRSFFKWYRCSPLARDC